MAKQIKDLLSDLLPKPDSWKLYLVQKWDTIIGELNMQVRLEKIQKDTLILSVSNASWMQELHCLSDILIKKINQHLEYPHVKQLRFKCTPRLKKATVMNTNDRKPFVFHDIALTGKQKQALERITDVQLQYVLKKFLARCYYTNQNL